MMYDGQAGELMENINRDIVETWFEDITQSEGRSKLKRLIVKDPAQFDTKDQDIPSSPEQPDNLNVRGQTFGRLEDVVGNYPNSDKPNPDHKIL